MLRIANRVRELQEEANDRLRPKADLSRERIGRRLDMASQMAEKQGNAAGIVSSELGIAKVFGLEKAQDSKTLDFGAARSMQDIGRKLLQGVGLKEPDGDSVCQAIEANNRFVAELEAIKARQLATIAT
jgi:hypothetical protein